MNKYSISFFIIIIGFLIILYIGYQREKYNEYVNELINNVVVETIRSNSSISIKFKGRNSFKPLYLSLSEELIISEGDSIVKNRNSEIVSIYKKKNHVWEFSLSFKSVPPLPLVCN